MKPTACRLLLFALLAALAACPHNTRKTLVPEVPQTGDSRARLRFQDARAKFLRDGTGAEEFRIIAEQFPDDPIVPWANLYAGVAAVTDRKYDVAVAALEHVLAAEVPEGVRQRAQLFMGIAKNYQGDASGALPLLKQGGKAVENETERTEFLAAVAYSTAVVEPISSLAYFDQLYPRVTATERALIVARTEQVVASATADQVRKEFDALSDRKGPGMAAVASRLAILADRAGNPSEAQRMREAAAPARQAVGLPKLIGTAIASGAGNAGLIGAVVPGGKPTKAGEGAIAGLALAGGAAGGGGVVAIELRTAIDSDAAALAVEDLARHDVIAVIGPIDAASVDKAGGRAEALGVPLLSLSGRPEERITGRWVFHIRHSAEARARDLAKRALGLGIRTFAILAPKDNYGASVSAAFVDEVGRAGGSIVKTVSYPADTKSFPQFASQLAGSWQALFVPEEAKKLALIAPSLSAAKLIPKPFGTKSTPGGRPILLLSTAEDLAGAFIADAGRHAEGALFAPGFYPDDRDPTQKAFLDRFIAAFGRAPGVVEAYSYDAAQLAAAASSTGRAGLAATLSNGSLVGLTGTIQFDPSHRRADPSVIYTVVSSGGVFAIRR